MNDTAQRFVIVDLRIPFVRLMLFFVKAALAAIPAAIIVGFLLMLATALIAGLARRWRLCHDAAMVVLTSARSRLSADIQSAPAAAPVRGDARRRARPASW